jgi:hypothetical protein
MFYAASCIVDGSVPADIDAMIIIETDSFEKIYNRGRTASYRMSVVYTVLGGTARQPCPPAHRERSRQRRSELSRLMTSAKTTL